MNQIYGPQFYPKPQGNQQQRLNTLDNPPQRYPSLPRIPNYQQNGLGNPAGINKFPKQFGRDSLITATNQPSNPQSHQIFGSAVQNPQIPFANKRDLTPVQLRQTRTNPQFYNIYAQPQNQAQQRRFLSPNAKNDDQTPLLPSPTYPHRQRLNLQTSNVINLAAPQIPTQTNYTSNIPNIRTPQEEYFTRSIHHQTSNINIPHNPVANNQQPYLLHPNQQYPQNQQVFREQQPSNVFNQNLLNLIQVQQQNQQIQQIQQLTHNHNGSQGSEQPRFNAHQVMQQPQQPNPRQNYHLPPQQQLSINQAPQQIQYTPFQNSQPEQKSFPQNYYISQPQSPMYQQLPQQPFQRKDDNNNYPPFNQIQQNIKNLTQPSDQQYQNFQVPIGPKAPKLDLDKKESYLTYELHIPNPGEDHLENLSRIQDPDSQEYLATLNTGRYNVKNNVNNIQKVIIIQNYRETEVIMELDKLPSEWKVIDIIKVALDMGDKMLIRPALYLLLGKALRQLLSPSMTIKELRYKYPEQHALLIEELQ